MEAGERRSIPDVKSRERRVIQRISSPSLRDGLKQTQILIRTLLIFGAAFAVALFYLRWGSGALLVNQALFFDVVVLMLWISLARYSRAISSYLKTESVDKITYVTEYQRDFWVVAVVVALIIGIAKIISLI